MVKPTRIFLSLEKGYETFGLNFVVISTPVYAKLTPPCLRIPKKSLGRLVLHDDSMESPQPIRPRGTGQEVLGRLATWLRERESEIPKSSQKGDEARLPTRVLDLRPPNFNDPSYLESDLCLLETAGQVGRYATLSYSWGGYNETRTLRDNYIERKHRIPFKPLPLVFQQAVKVTRGLGIRYLWIDALCIIQEDAEDWSREGARMFEIYGMSTVRLAVTDSSNPTESFFPPSENVSVKMPHLQLQQPILDPGLNAAMAADLLPKTEEEKLMLQQHKAEMLSLYRENMKSTIDPDEEDIDLHMPIGRHRRVSEPTNLKWRETAKSQVTRRDGHILRKLPQTTHLGSKAARDSLEDNPGGIQCTKVDSRTDIGGVAFEKQQRRDLDGVKWMFSDAPDRGDDGDDVWHSKWSRYIHEKSMDIMEKHLNTRPKKEYTNQPKATYLSMPRLYSEDVDMGRLNARGWVLQERLLAPRTIHFTKSHIYCEDSDDICGEDWVRWFFTWMSCIRKESSHAQLNLFPERSSVYNFTTQPGEHVDSDKASRLQWQRALYRKPESQHMRRPWHNISESYSSCQLSFDSDRLAAIAGVIQRKCMDPKSIHADGRNLCGLWEKTLHLDLAWFCKGGNEAASPRRIRDLGLPSWSWISCQGPITFVRDSRSAMGASTRLTNTFGAVELVEAQVPKMMDSLPLAKPSSLTVRVALRRLYGLSTNITKYGTTECTREHLAKSSPFDFDPRTTTLPIPLSSMTECQEIFNENRQLVGFMCFDDNIHIVGDLFCAHISTLTDEAFEVAQNDLAVPGVESVDLRDYQRPILSYALVLAKVKAEETTYQRVGLAEVNYYWMTSVERMVIKLL